ncbi:hypothetical protein BDV41DRAFT_544827 [Aspergillus transmontanensis]|uniref:Uncharacterized protein n=1 Tax=Aspergillus transmontanensis TaxID=1034304 RepID=A0A5N6VQ45_9EURO|nr:hypothetical protein BDV41DRAFT_544827 [Aspergillus transmontanensis]
MFGRISEFLSNWIPSEPTEPRPTTVNHTPFDATSDQVRRTQTSGERTGSLPVGSSVDTFIHSPDVCGLFPYISLVRRVYRAVSGHSYRTPSGAGLYFMHGLNLFAFFF